MSGFLLIPIFLSCLVLALPWPVVLRLAGLVILGLLVLIRLEPPLHFSDRGAFHIPTGTIVGMLLCLPAMALVLRAVVSVFRETKIDTGRSEFDALVAGAAGAVAALWAFIAFAWVLSGSDAPVLIHLAVLALGAFAGKIAWDETGLCRGVAIGMSCTLVALTVWSAFVHPSNVLEAAVSLADGRAFCIQLQKRDRAARYMGDLTFLTMDKLGYPRHALLVIEGEDPEDAAHWSYHRQDFRRRGGPLDATRCIP